MSNYQIFNYYFFEWKKNPPNFLKSETCVSNRFSVQFEISLIKRKLDVKDIQFQNFKVLKTQSQNFATFLEHVWEFKTRKEGEIDYEKHWGRELTERLFPVVLTSGKCHIWLSKRWLRTRSSSAKYNMAKNANLEEKSRE